MEFHGDYDHEGEESKDDTRGRCFLLAPLFYAHSEAPADEGNLPSGDVLPLLVLEPCTPAWGI